MPAKCSICGHAERAEMDAGLLEGRSMRAIAGQYGVSKSALERHGKKCGPGEAVRERVKASQTLRADNLLQSLQGIVDRTREIGREFRDAKPDLALRALAREEKQLALAERMITAARSSAAEAEGIRETVWEWERMAAVISDWDIDQSGRDRGRGGEELRAVVSVMCDRRTEGLVSGGIMRAWVLALRSAIAAAPQRSAGQVASEWLARNTAAMASGQKPDAVGA